MFTLVYPLSTLFMHIHRSRVNHVTSRLSQVNLVYPSIPLVILVYPHIPRVNHVTSRLLQFNLVYFRIPIVNLVLPCLSTYTHNYPYLTTSCYTFILVNPYSFLIVYLPVLCFALPFLLLFFTFLI